MWGPFLVDTVTGLVILPKLSHMALRALVQMLTWLVTSNRLAELLNQITYPMTKMYCDRESRPLASLRPHSSLANSPTVCSMLEGSDLSGRNGFTASKTSLPSSSLSQFQNMISYSSKTKPSTACRRPSPSSTPSVTPDGSSRPRSSSS